MTPPIACTIAGSDPSGGAGLQADLRTFAAHGVHGAAVIAGLTVQDTRAVYRAEPVAPDLAAAQLQHLLDDMTVGAIKTGMLGNGDVLEAVADVLKQTPPRWLVVDPVLAATAGGQLFDPADLAAYRNVLAPLAQLLTPNLDEAAALLGQAIAASDRAEAALMLARQCQTAVLLKGGHAQTDADDCLALAGEVHWLRAERLPLGATHGTGCHLSAAIAARLAKGDELLTAVGGAKAWLHAALRHAVKTGRGAVSPWPF